jgi:hypothetical protein
LSSFRVAGGLALAIDSVYSQRSIPCIFCMIKILFQKRPKNRMSSPKTTQVQQTKQDRNGKIPLFNPL